MSSGQHVQGVSLRLLNMRASFPTHPPPSVETFSAICRDFVRPQITTSTEFAGQIRHVAESFEREYDTTKGPLPQFDLVRLHTCEREQGDSKLLELRRRVDTIAAEAWIAVLEPERSFEDVTLYRRAEFGPRRIPVLPGIVV